MKVAWHEVPGNMFPTRFRPVGNGMSDGCKPSSFSSPESLRLGFLLSCLASEPLVPDHTVPLGRIRVYGKSRHFVPGYLH